MANKISIKPHPTNHVKRGFTIPSPTPSPDEETDINSPKKL